MIEVGWQAGGRGLQHLEIIRNILPESGKDHRHLHNRLLIVAGLERNLQAVLVQHLLAVRLSRQADHDEVVRHPPGGLTLHGPGGEGGVGGLAQLSETELLVVRQHDDYLIFNGCWGCLNWHIVSLSHSN